MCQLARFQFISASDFKNLLRVVRTGKCLALGLQVLLFTVVLLIGNVEPDQLRFPQKTYPVRGKHRRIEQSFKEAPHAGHSQFELR